MTDFNNGENPQKQSISGSGYAYVNIPPRHDALSSCR
jgi:hypothetical protein